MLNTLTDLAAEIVSRTSTLCSDVAFAEEVDDLVGAVVAHVADEVERHLGRLDEEMLALFVGVMAEERLRSVVDDLRAA